MTPRRTLSAVAVAVLAIALGWLLFVGLPRWYGGPASKAGATLPPDAPAAPGRTIKARLFYIADDGTRLAGVERDVAYGEGTVEQARQMIEAQIAPVAEPLVSAVPAGTRLRALFVSDRGTAYVDLSREVAAAHTGGSVNELLTVYAIVNVLTANLPAITAVQVLVDGKEVETLAGHVDLRLPLVGNATWVQ